MPSICVDAGAFTAAQLLRLQRSSTIKPPNTDQSSFFSIVNGLLKRQDAVRYELISPRCFLPLCYKTADKLFELLQSSAGILFSAVSEYADHVLRWLLLAPKFTG